MYIDLIISMEILGKSNSFKALTTKNSYWIPSKFPRNRVQRIIEYSNITVGPVLLLLFKLEFLKLGKNILSPHILN